MSQSDTDSSDDSEAEKIRSALDPTFSLGIDGSSGNKSSDVTKSNGRDAEEHTNGKGTEWDSGHSSQTFQITPEMKKFIAKRLETALDKQIKIVDIYKEKTFPANSVSSSVNSSCGLFLFPNSSHPVSQSDLIQQEAGNSTTKRKRLKFKKRKIDDSDSEDESEKLKSVAVTFDWVLNKTI